MEDEREKVEALEMSSTKSNDKQIIEVRKISKPKNGWVGSRESDGDKMAAEMQPIATERHKPQITVLVCEHSEKFLCPF